MTILNKDKNEQGKSKRKTIPKRHNLKKDKSGNDKSEKGQFWKGKI